MSDVPKKKGSVATLGDIFGLSPATLDGLFRASGQRPAQAPSYEGVTLQSMAPQASAPSPAAASVAAPSYEGVTLQSMPAAKQASPKYAVSAMDSGASGPKRDGRIAPVTGDNVDTTASGGNNSNVVLPDMTAHSDSAKASEEDPRSAGSASSFAAPPVTLPAHWQPGSHAVSIAHGIPEEALADGRTERELGYQHAYQAANDHLDAAQKMGQAEAAYNAAKAAGDAHGAEIAAAREAEKRAYVADEHAKLEALNTQAQKQVDPDAYWKERGTGARIAAAVAIGLGTFGSLYMHGPNTALQIINEGINANVDAQKANIATARGAFADRSSLYRQNLEAFGDRERADLATKMQYLDQVSSMVNQIRAGAKDADAEAARHDMLSQLYMQRAKYADQFGELTSAKVTEQGNEHFVPAMTMGGGGAGSKREHNLARTSDGTTYHFDTPALAKEVIGKIDALGNMKFIAGEILKTRQALANLPFAGEEAKRQELELNAKKLTRELMTAESKAADQGVVTKADAAADAEIGLSGDSDMSRWSHLNPYATTNRQGTDAAYRDMIGRWQKQEHAHATAAFGEVYNPTYQHAADGSFVPTGNYTGQDPTPDPHVAPAGSRPIDGRIDNLPTASRPERETIPQAPIKGGVYAPPASRGRPKKDDSFRAPKPTQRKAR